MKINLNIPLKNQNGKEQADLIAKDGICISLLASSDQKETPDNKYKKYSLWNKIVNAKEDVDLSVEELKLIKDVVGMFQSPLVMGQIWDLIENQKKGK